MALFCCERAQLFYCDSLFGRDFQSANSLKSWCTNSQAFYKLFGFLERKALRFWLGIWLFPVYLPQDPLVHGCWVSISPVPRSELWGSLWVRFGYGGSGASCGSFVSSQPLLASLLPMVILGWGGRAAYAECARKRSERNAFFTWENMEFWISSKTGDECFKLWHL